MRNVLKGLGSHVLFGVMFAGMSSCAEKAPEAKPKIATTGKSATNNSGDVGESPSSDSSEDATAVTASYDVCKGLKGSSTLLSSFKSFVGKLCDDPEKLNTLRGSGVIYKGSGTPSILISAKEEANKITQMELMASMLSSAKAADHYAMVKMQVAEPDKFSSAGFAYNKDVKYKVLSDAKNEVKYQYLNEQDKKAVVNYQATAYFFEIEKGQLYAVGTKSDDSYADWETVKKMSGLIVISQRGSDLEVFTYSEQSIDNAGNHETAHKRAKTEFQKEQQMSFDNSKMSSKAN